MILSHSYSRVDGDIFNDAYARPAKHLQVSLLCFSLFPFDNREISEVGVLPKCTMAGSCFLELLHLLRSLPVPRHLV